ncbi:hypothetical protein HYX07_03800, partial [Candidatus Woesearchaeota archaeon]|nr:hypothetical protein [Candidatus Woesearchaeota archaeon]
DFLRKKDKSKKGFIDKDAVKIVNCINSKSDYYTTSSCAGRIVLLEMKSERKNDCDWIFSKHDKIRFKEIINALKKNKNQSRELPLKAGKKEETSFESCFKHPVWFKQQPIILHVACRNLDAAKRLLDLARKVFKHSGILSITDRKVTIQIIGSERIDTIIADKNFAADEKYLKKLLKYANNNFKENKRKSRRFFKILRSNL